MARIHRKTIPENHLNDPDNHNSVITHLEPDILEFKVKWASLNKASGGDGIPAKLFKILKDTVKVLHSICQKIWKNSAVPIGLEKVSFHSSAMPKNAQTTTQLHSFHMLAR